MVAFNMDKIVTDIKDVPYEWIYKHYCALHGREINQPFDGRNIIIKSFTNRDTTPSLIMFYKNGKYLWKDHSSGQSGTAVGLVSNLLSKNIAVTIEQIVKDYEDFLGQGGDPDEFVRDVKASTIDLSAKIKNFDYPDLDYWTAYHIKARVIHTYNVHPLTSYTLVRDGKEVTYGNLTNVFGYYKKVTKDSLELYQIYIPGKTPKYLSKQVKYLIGSDQLKFESNICVIVSGLKDLMALESLELNVETVAPKSENTILSYDEIEFLKSKYKYIVTMFDNDPSGLKAMEMYKRVYDIPYVHISLEKDLADNNKMRNLDFLKANYAFLIDKKINLL